MFEDYTIRRSAILQALTSGVDEFYARCEPKEENLCLFGSSSRKVSWQVELPSEEFPSELPEPTPGINFCRDGMKKSDWLSLVAIHSDCWLVSVAFYFAARLWKRERRLLYVKMNALPTVYEVIKQRRLAAETGLAGVECGRKSDDSRKRARDGELEGGHQGSAEN